MSGVKVLGSKTIGSGLIDIKMEYLPLEYVKSYVLEKGFPCTVFEDNLKIVIRLAYVGDEKEFKLDHRLLRKSEKISLNKLLDKICDFR